MRIVSVGAGAWGSVFAALLQDTYGQFRDKIQIRIWRRAGRIFFALDGTPLPVVFQKKDD